MQVVYLCPHSKRIKVNSCLVMRGQKFVGESEPKAMLRITFFLGTDGKRGELLWRKKMKTWYKQKLPVLTTAVVVVVPAEMKIKLSHPNASHNLVVTFVAERRGREKVLQHLLQVEEKGVGELHLQGLYS